MDKITKEYSLKYSVASSSKKTYHVGRFRSSQPIDFAKWSQPVHMHRQEDPPKDESQQHPAARGSGLVVRSVPRNSKDRGNMKPWVLEDSPSDKDKGHSFIGTREAVEDAQYVLFLMQGEEFRVIPAADWYHFRPKGANAPTIEEAEKLMAMRGDKMLRLITRAAPRSAAATGDNNEPGAEDEDQVAVESDDDRWAEFAKDAAAAAAEAQQEKEKKPRVRSARAARSEEDGDGSGGGESDGGAPSDDEEDMEAAAGDPGAEGEGQEGSRDVDAAAAANDDKHLSASGREMRNILKELGERAGADDDDDEDEDEEEGEEDDADEDEEEDEEGTAKKPQQQRRDEEPKESSGKRKVAVLDDARSKKPRTKKDDTAPVATPAPAAFAPPPAPPSQSATQKIKSEPGAKPPVAAPRPGDVTEDEIRQAFKESADGRLRTKDLIQRFKHRLSGDAQAKDRFSALVQRLTKLQKDPAGGETFIVLKPQPPAAAV